MNFLNAGNIKSSNKDKILIVAKLRDSKELEKDNNPDSSSLQKSSRNTFNPYKTHSPKLNNKKKLISSNLKPEHDYTIFTSRIPSNLLLAYNKPIKGKVINDTFKTRDDLIDYSRSILKETTLLELDKVYDETQSIDKLYQDLIHPKISALMHRQNSSIFLFGPIKSGKTFLLSGKDDKKAKTKGFLVKAIDDIFGLIDLARQGNIKSLIKYTFQIKVSSYHIYLDSIIDLLNLKYPEIKIEKYFDERGVNCKMLGLMSRIIKNRKDFEYVLREGLSKKNTVKDKGNEVPDIKRKSHTVFCIQLERLDEKENSEIYAQIDFVKLASTDYGLINFGKNLKIENKVLYRSINRTYNSVAVNIVAACSGFSPKNESKLTLCLKPTLNPDSNIIFINCISPWEYPLAQSFRSLKFTNWVRNQVINVRRNKELGQMNFDNPDFRDEYNEEEIPIEEEIEEQYNIQKGNEGIYNRDNIKQTNRKYTQGRIGENENIKMRDFPYNEEEVYNKERGNEGDFNRDNSTQANREYMQGRMRENEVRGIPYSEWSNNRNQMMQYQNNSNNFQNLYKRGIPQYQTQNQQNINSNQITRNFLNPINQYYGNRNTISGNQYQTQNDNNYSNNFNNNYLPQNRSRLSTEKNNSPIMDDIRMQSVDNSLQEIENKKSDITESINNIRKEAFSYNDNNYFQQSINKNNPEAQNKNLNEFILLDYTPKNYSNLQNDNINLKENISQLNEEYQNLQEELNFQLNQNSEILSQNQNLIRDKQNLERQFQIIKEEKVKKEMNKQQEPKSLYEKLNSKYSYENRVKDNKREMSLLREEKTKFETKYSLLNEKFMQMKRNYDDLSEKLSLSKMNREEQVDSIEKKLTNITRKIDILQEENIALKKREKLQQQELLNVVKERDELKEKYDEQEYTYKELSERFNEIEINYNNIIYENEEMTNQKKDEIKKGKVFDELKRKLEKYKNERIKMK